MGYALVFISHNKDKTFKTKTGVEYNQTIPTCATSFNNIAKDMSDIYAYAEKYTDDEGVGKVRLVLRSPDNSAETGCRFKYIKPILEDFNYQAVVDALNAAIDKEAAMNGNQYVTTDREAAVEKTEYDYDALMTEFQEIAGNLMNENAQYYGPRITQIVDKYLGKGHKIADATIDQAELVSLIVAEVREDLMKK